MQTSGVYGRDVVVDDWVVALLRYGRAPSYRLFQTRDRQRARPIPGHERVEELARSRRDTTITIDDIADAPRMLGLEDRYVWHDPDGGLDAAIAMRRYASRMYPVTATSHVLSYRSFLHHLFLRLLLQDVRPCDSFICISQSTRTAAQKLFDGVADRLQTTRRLSCRFRGRFDIIPLGVDTERFQPRDKTEIRRAIGLPEDAFLITWVGRFSFRDKADLLPLLTVFARLVKANPRRTLCLVLAGSGVPLVTRVLRRHTEALGVAERVRFIEPLAPDRRHLIHAAADVFVSVADNIQEMFGLTPLEAMASGVPQVVADWAGYREAVVHGETGFLIPTWLADADAEANAWVGSVKGEDFVDHLLMAQATAIDLDALQAASQQLIDNDDLRVRMADASRRRALDQYAWPHIVTRYEALWEELALIADSLPPGGAGCADYAEPAFVSAFRHYATSVLTDDARFRLSEAGRRVLRGEEALPLYLKPMGLWSSDVLAEILWSLERSGPPMTMGDLPGVATGEFDDVHGSPGPHVARRHVMWLLKYGLIELVR
jgi:D-inositol-3-phosphate glycosyltransferase